MFSRPPSKVISIKSLRTVKSGKLVGWLSKITKCTAIISKQHHRHHCLHYSTITITITSSPIIIPIAIVTTTSRLIFRNHKSRKLRQCLDLFDAVIQLNQDERKTFDVVTSREQSLFRSSSIKETECWIEAIQRHNQGSTTINEEFDKAQRSIESFEYYTASARDALVRRMSDMNGVLSHPKAVEYFMNFLVSTSYVVNSSFQHV